MTEHPQLPDAPAAPPGHPSDDALNELLDGRLPPDEQARVEAHVAGCARCRAERDALAAVIALGASARPEPRDRVPPDVWPLVAATTIHERRLRRHVLRAMRVPLLIGALALALASAYAGLVAGRALAARDVPAGPEAEEARLQREMDEARTRERRAMERGDAAERRAIEQGDAAARRSLP